jgi:hypothetical protein
MLPVLADLLHNVRHPYKQVRDTIATVIGEIMQIWWYPATSLHHTLMQNVQSLGGLHPNADKMAGVLPLTMHPDVKDMVASLLISMDEWRGIEKESNSVPTDYANASKTGIVVHLFQTRF